MKPAKDTRSRPTAATEHAVEQVPERALRAQSLALGAAGVALLPIERARHGSGSWEAAHAALAGCARHALITSTDASLYLGAPAFAFALHTAAAGSTRYAGASGP